MGAIVTTFAVHDALSACSLVKWCDNARAISNYTNADVVVYTDSTVIVQQLCPHAIMRTFDPMLLRAKDAYVSQSRSNSRMRTKDLCADTLLKFAVLTATEYSSVLYLDADVDSSFGKVDRRSRMLDDVPGYMRNFSLSPCQIRATPDHSALINDGVMLLKPSMVVYKEALRVMRRAQFNLSHGHDFVGPPKRVITKPHPLVMRAMGYWKDTWNFVCSGGSQGLLSYLYLVRRPAEAFCVPVDWWVRVRHFWADDKPWQSRSCRSYYKGFQHRHSLPYCKPFFAESHRNSIDCRGRLWPIL